MAFSLRTALFINFLPSLTYLGPRGLGAVRRRHEDAERDDPLLRNRGNKPEINTVHMAHRGLHGMRWCCEYMPCCALGTDFGSSLTYGRSTLVAPRGLHAMRW